MKLKRDVKIYCYNTKFHTRLRGLCIIMTYKEWKKGHIDSERKCK